ncbi:hypothetical protein Trydic_g4199 [Trypoxylus dichotomus]
MPHLEVSSYTLQRTFNTFSVAASYVTSELEVSPGALSEIRPGHCAKPEDEEGPSHVPAHGGQASEGPPTWSGRGHRRRGNQPGFGTTRNPCPVVKGNGCETDRPIPLVFVQLTKNDDSKEIFQITHVCGINVPVESKLIKKDQIMQYHRCQLYRHRQRNCHAAVVCVKCAGQHQTADCMTRTSEMCYMPGQTIKDASSLCARGRGKFRSSRPRLLTYSDPHNANRRPQRSHPAEKASESMEADTPLPSASTAKPSYATAIKKNAVRKTKTSKKRKTHSTPSGPILSPKKPVASQPPTKPSPAIVTEVADYDASETTSRQKTNVMSTLSQLIPLTQKINRVYRTVREDVRGGGTAILIKSSIDHHADLALDLNSIEAIAITATGPVKLITAYKALNRLLLGDDLPEIFDTRGAVILVGDLNAKHSLCNSRLTNASGTCLRRFADDFHLLVDATVKPTIFRHNGQPDVLDIVVMKDVAQFHQLTVLNVVRSQSTAATTWTGGTRRR